ncbi:polymorphic toxin type 44 domain-containing protein [Enterobacter cloacae]|uniref:polymorphic toxin type 44 domain-containing protein n=3 Tax=Enterobacter cloacae TaxID=550 RepID=UPI001F192FC2|nr:polymorphic toxin type 44 domain-containing protein [Enterobacter cloacae]MCJ8539104.1 polymorphic toxin type 44 domain-containing protein [Enterobacter cloacae]MCK7217736.1 polymorphic toxin type 44 domain-containing protein [Enterobacter cloacae]MCQ4409849.1 polymorphic toxin type 44 domain-containing protein [Enterobacter cloacae]MDK9962692.1 polymorphic toxin type 44 domain-containing protein [Enterobacter cloacae]MDV0875918.1 polymorphic toxin type 44 domain-containing protein [Enterob
MPAKGFYLVQGDKTTCGGRIITGAEDHTLFGKPVAREQDGVTCGKFVGLYKVAGGIDNDTIHGRRMAGTLDSYSSCPCKAKFIPSMMDDTYEKSGGSVNSAGETTAATATATSSASSLATSPATIPAVTTTGQSSDLKNKPHCQHTDGAIKVADYILKEIKTNVRSQTAETIRYLIDEDTLNQRRDEWNNLPFYAKLAQYPKPDLPAAMAIWYQTVKTGSTWDHKPIIRKKFKSVAVTRPLESKQMSESYYHKYKEYDFYLDVWSNIHYGYVGLSVGFSEGLLLKGSTWEQNMTPGAMGEDTLDDITSMKIGFKLYHRFGKYAEKLTSQHILEALLNISINGFSESRTEHWCWNEKNPERINMPAESQ